MRLLLTSERFPCDLHHFQQNDFAEAIQRSELDTWTFTKEVDNPELQGLARIRGHLDVMAQQLAALGDIEEAHKAEKNVVLEKLEHARVELFTTIDSAMPKITQEKAIVQAALEFVELPGDRERLRSPGLGYKTAGDQPDDAPRGSKVGRRSPHSIADSAPRSLNFTDMESSGEEEAGSDNYNDEDDYDDYGEIPGSGWAVLGFLVAILGVGVRVNRKHLGLQVRKWRDERFEALKHHRRAAKRRAESTLLRKPPHIQQRHQPRPQRLHSSTQHQVSNYELQRLKDRDSGVMSLRTSERTGYQPTSSNQVPSAAATRPSSPPRSSPRSPSPQRIAISSGFVNNHSWRWRPHVLLGRG